MRSPESLGQTANLDQTIDENQPMRLIGARGRIVECLRGSLWISVAGLAQDFHIQAGQSLTIPANSLVLVGTLAKTTVLARLRPAPSGPSRQRHADTMGPADMSGLKPV